MDRSTKERLTGAIVLVAVAWLVIPVFLDGPADQQETVRQRVDLPGQDGQQPTRTKTIVLNPQAENSSAARDKITDPAPASRELQAPPPEPAARPTDEDAQTLRPGPELQETAESQAGRTDPSAAPAAAPESPEQSSQQSPAESLWAVQLGSFSSEENAEGLAADLRKRGFAAFLSRVESGGRHLHRVRVGPQGSRDDAEKIASKLAAAGHDGQVVTHP